MIKVTIVNEYGEYSVQYNNGETLTELLEAVLGAIGAAGFPYVQGLTAFKTGGDSTDVGVVE